MTFEILYLIFGYLYLAYGGDQVDKVMMFRHDGCDFESYLMLVNFTTQETSVGRGPSVLNTMSLLE